MNVKRYVGVVFYVSLATTFSARAQDKGKKEDTYVMPYAQKSSTSSTGLGPVPPDMDIVYPLLDSTWRAAHEGIGGGDPMEEHDMLIDEEASVEYHFLDTTWMRRYYAVKDSRHLDPYKKKGLKDTVTLQLSHPEDAITWTTPLPSTVVTSGFGWRRRRWHRGVDLRLSRGDTVYAASYGVVRLKKYQRRGFGHYLVLHHYNGLETVYAHLARSLVKEGQIVLAGEPVGLGGNTGRSSAPHLHFEVRYEGKPMDPTKLFDLNKGSLLHTSYALTASDFPYLRETLHRVRQGQTLIRIAKRYGTTVSSIKKLNRLRSSRIYVGQKLRIRTPSAFASSKKVHAKRSFKATHRIRRGETLSHIAKRYGTTVSSIKKQNGLRSSRIYPGQKLRVP